MLASEREEKSNARKITDLKEKNIFFYLPD